MKTLLKVVLALALMQASVWADVQKGQKIYLKTYKGKFGLNGVQFASLHTVQEWKELFENQGEGFIEAFSQTYPKAAKMLQAPNAWKKLQHIKDFAMEYANDSGNVPSCG